MSTPPAVPLGYRARLNSSEKDLPLSTSKELPNQHSPNSAKRGSRSGSGSESPEIRSPVSDVFYGTQRKHASSAPAFFRTALDKDKKGVDTTRDEPKVNASNSYIDDGCLSVDASEVASALFKVDSGNSESELEGNKIAFYLPSEDDHESHTESTEKSVENLDKGIEVVAGSDPAVDSDKAENQLQYDPEGNKDSFSQPHKETNFNSKDAKFNLGASQNDNANNFGEVMTSETIEKVDSSDNLIADPDTGNKVYTSEEINLIDVMDEHIYPAKIYQSKSEPTMFVFPSPAASNTDEESVPGLVKGNSPVNFSPEVHSLDSDEENNIDFDMSYHVSQSIADDMIDSDNKFSADFENDSVVNLKTVADNEIGTNPVNLDSLGEDTVSVGSWPAALPNSHIDESMNKVVPEEPPIKPPDLISSLPFLPLLTPYSSEDSGTERVSTTSTAERLNSATDEDVFYDDSNKAGNAGRQSFIEAVPDGKIEGHLEEKASDIHVPLEYR